MLVSMLQQQVGKRNLDPLFAPRSVAVVGASRDPAKWGGLLARKALAGAHRRSVHLVNRRGGEILGAPAYPSLADLPERPELVVACVPATEFDATVGEALEAGARAIVGISAGVDGRAAGERTRAAGAVLLGPNCLGVFDREAELDLAAWAEFPAGDIGLIAQSGNLSLELGLLAEREGLGFSRFASLGNQADLEAADLLEDFARHEPTRLVALYVEDFRDGRAFARAARDAGKPVVLLAAGVSDAGARAARSHTGALVSDLAAVDAACRAAGIVRVSTPRELVDAAKALLARPPLRGRRIAILGDGGGHVAVAADLLTAAGLEPQDPVDLAGAGERDVTTFARVGRPLLDSADALLVTGFFGGYGTEAERQTAAALADAPVVLHTMYPESDAARELPLVYREIESAVRALAVLQERETRDIPDPADDAEPVPEDYFSARALVASAGVPLAEARVVASLEEALAAASELGYPVVLKSLAHEHKSRAGGVVLGVGGADELAAAWDGHGSVERMAPGGGGVELIVGVRRDPRFGPLLLVGLGGVHAELLRDVAVALAPVEPDEAERLLRSLRGAAMLDGLDVAAAARAASALSRLSAPWLAELEVNPLLVTRDGAVGLDARLVHAGTMEPR
jgi:acyl-CoA synthetase (NDP forming)